MSLFYQSLFIPGQLGISWTTTHMELRIHLQKIHAINGRLVGNGTTTMCTKPFLLQVIAVYQELISFLITATAKHPIILAFPWMHLHVPQISYDKEITKWSTHCKGHWLHLPLSYHILNHRGES